MKYYDLFYCKEDYGSVVDAFCNSSKVKGIGVEDYKEDLVVLAQEIKDNETEKPSFSSYRLLDDSLIDWVKSTYREYKVNIIQFTEGYMWKYNERYIERKYDSKFETHYIALIDIIIDITIILFQSMKCTKKIVTALLSKVKRVNWKCS